MRALVCTALARVSPTVIALWALGLGGLDLAVAQTPPARPPNTVDAYVLLGLSKIDVSSSIQFTTGSIGVNQSGGTLTGNGAVQLNQQDGVVAASTVTLNQPSTCAALFADSGNGSGQCSPVQPIPSPQPPLVPDVQNSDICRLPSPFPTCSSQNVTVDAGTVSTLDPGTYGNLTVNGGTLMLVGNGAYVFCNVDVNNGSIVTVAAPSTLQVSDRFNVQPDALINAEGTPTDLRVLVNGLGVNITGSSTSPRTTVVAQICAPTMNSQMNLMSATLGGTFVADAINVGNVSGGLGPVVPTTTTTTSTSTSTTSTTSSTTSTTTSTTSTSSTTSSTSTTSTSTSSTSTSSATTSSSSTSSTTSSTSAPSTTSTSTSTSVSPTTTTLPCDDLTVTSIKFTPRKRNSTTGRLVISGVLADSGWADVDPRQDDAHIGIQTGGETSNCTIDSQFWTKNFPAHFGFFDQKRSICPPLACVSLVVRRNGSAAFKITAPGVDLTEEDLKDIELGVVIGGHCSAGTLSPTNLRRKGRALVYP